MRWKTFATLLALVASLAVSPLCCFELLYRYYLARLPRLSELPADTSSSFASEALWIIEGDGGEGVVEPSWARSVFEVGERRRAAWARRGVIAASMRVAKSWVHRNPDRDRSRSHLDRALIEVALNVWLSRHASAAHLKRMLAENLYFGRGARGLWEASAAYFGREVEALSVAEVALLVGVPQSPRGLDPSCHPDLALVRRSFVLRRMRSEGLIDDVQLEAACREPLGALPDYFACPSRVPVSRGAVESPGS